MKHQRAGAKPSQLVPGTMIEPLDTTGWQLFVRPFAIGAQKNCKPVPTIRDSQSNGTLVRGSKNSSLSRLY